jgi:hypothetical protein
MIKKNDQQDRRLNLNLSLNLPVALAGFFSILLQAREHHPTKRLLLILLYRLVVLDEGRGELMRAVVPRHKIQ